MPVTVVPGTTGLACPPAAAALGVAGGKPACPGAASTAGFGSIFSHLAGFGVQSVLDALGGWVSAGAVWLLRQIGDVLDTTTRIDLSASWFSTHFATMAALAALVLVPLLLVAAIQAIVRQSATMLLRAFLLNVPAAVLLTAVAVKLVQLGLALTDALSRAVAGGSAADTGRLLAPVATVLQAASAGGGTVPAFVLLVGSLAVVVGAFLLWLELLVREAAVYAAVLFLPLALASLAWPAISHWCRRLVDTLVALVLSKFVIVAVLSLATGALAAGAHGSGPAGGFTTVLGGAALLLLAAAAPWALLRLVPFVEAGAVAHLEGAGRTALRPVTAPVAGLARHALRAAGEAAVVGGALAAEGPVGTGVAETTGGAGLGGLAATASGGSPPVGSPPGGAGRAGTDAGPDAGSDAGPASAASVPLHPTVPAAATAYEEERRAWAVATPGPPGAPERSRAQHPRADVGPPVAPGPTAAPGEWPVLARPTGSDVRHALSHDRLGPRLVTLPPGAQPPGGQPLGEPLPGEGQAASERDG